MTEIYERETSVSNMAALCAGVETPPRWVAVYTTPRHEKRVSEILAERQIETFLPLYRTTQRWKKRRPVELELPLFPTYVFVSIARDARGAVLGTPGVLSIVGSGREPWGVADSEIEALRNGLKDRRFQRHPYLTLGSRARVISGVLSGLEGIIVRIKNDLHIVLNLDQIMQSVAIEVDAGELEPVTQRPAQSLGSTRQCVHGYQSYA